MSWHSNPTTCWKLENKCVLSMSASLNVISANFYHCGRIAHTTRHRWGPNPPSCKQHGENKRTEHEEYRRVFGPAGPHFSRPANHFRPSVEVNHLCLRARYHQNRELRARRDPHERTTNTRNYNMFRQSGELSDVAQTARRTRKHCSSAMVEEQRSFLQSWLASNILYRFFALQIKWT